MERRKDDVNGKQVGIGCLIFVLIMAVVIAFGESSGIKAFLGLIAIIALFLLGAFLTGAFKD